MPAEGNELRMFVTVDGREVTVRPVSQYMIQKAVLAVEQRYRESGELIDPPTYTVTTASGATETYPHDETTLQTDEDKAAWQRYQDAMARLGREKMRVATELYLLRGLVIEEPPQEWLDEMAVLGIQIATDARQRKLDYIQIEVLKTPEDLIRATMAITRLSASGVPDEGMRAVEAQFRRALERAAISSDQPAQG